MSKFLMILGISLLFSPLAGAKTFEDIALCEGRAQAEYSNCMQRCLPSSVKCLESCEKQKTDSMQECRDGFSG